MLRREAQPRSPRPEQSSLLPLAPHYPNVRTSLRLFWSQSQRSGAGCLGRLLVCKEAAPPQTLSKSCARAVTLLSFGLESLSPTPLSFQGSDCSQVQTDRVFGTKSLEKEGHGVTRPVPPSLVLGGGVCRIVPQPETQLTRPQVARGAVQHQRGAGSQEPRAPSGPTLRSRALDRASGRRPHSALPALGSLRATRPPGRRALSPRAASAQ